MSENSLKAVRQRSLKAELQHSLKAELQRLGLGLFLRQPEGSRTNRLSDGAAANALSANSHRAIGAILVGDMDGLEIRLEGPSGNTGDLGTNASQVLRFTANRDLIPHLRAFAAHIANTRHDFPAALARKKRKSVADRRFPIVSR
jgi:hypothetical protein